MKHPRASSSAATDQAEVFAFLGDPRSWPRGPSRVDVIETHGALVFLADTQVLKVRRAVKLPYLDFSTLEARRQFAQREIEINAPHAPGLYLGVVAITREADGQLAVAGKGVAVEWAVRMARFDQDQLLSHVVAMQGITPVMAIELADAIVDYHAVAERRSDDEDRLPEIASALAEALAQAENQLIRSAAGRFRAAAELQLVRSRDIRRERARSGHVRRCHGDLHLANIVLWQGRPVPFDAIEFDETLATIDTLYDLAFPLMDLERNSARAAANLVLNRYLWRTGDRMDLRGLAALALYLGVRAAVRAVVALDRAKLYSAADKSASDERSLAALALAEQFLAPAGPSLVAIGGLSGTGKTTLAAAIAPMLGASPGAVHLRSDLERKWLAGVSETARLPASAYTSEASAMVYARVASRAADALAAGHSVIVDAVFAKPDERLAVEALTRDAGVPFRGLWLDADPTLLEKRVAARAGDASDATPAVVERQRDYKTGNIGWQRLDANGELVAVCETAREVLGMKT